MFSSIYYLFVVPVQYINSYYIAGQQTSMTCLDVWGVFSYVIFCLTTGTPKLTTYMAKVWQNLKYIAGPFIKYCLDYQSLISGKCFPTRQLPMWLFLQFLEQLAVSISIPWYIFDMHGWIPSRCKYFST